MLTWFDADLILILILLGNWDGHVRTTRPATVVFAAVIDLADVMNPLCDLIRILSMRKLNSTWKMKLALVNCHDFTRKVKKYQVVTCKRTSIVRFLKIFN